MPIRSPGDVPTGTIRDLRLPRRAVTALTRAGVTSLDGLAALTRRDLSTIPGLGPAMIDAIRVAVPEPSTSGPRPGAATEPEPAEEESPEAPVIPSFDSLRDPRRRPALDALVAPASPTRSAAGPAPAGTSRPAEYPDLWRLGGRVARAVVGAPWRVARWSVREPVRCVRRLVGG